MSAQGPEVVARVGELLRGIGPHEPGGISTTDVARVTGMPRPTAHRLLVSLARQGLVDRDEATGSWHLGPELHFLGAAASARYDVGEPGRRVVRDLALRTGESAFLSARRGDETVCLVAEEGSFPLRSHVLHEGIRFPLGVASAGLAVLSHMKEREITEYLDRSDLESRWGSRHARSEILARVSETLESGYATNPGLVVEGSWGMGAAVFDRTGEPAWALSITGVESRFRDERRPELGRLLLERGHQLTRLLAKS